jgi:HSP20 family protein
MARFFAPAITFGQNTARSPAVDPFRLLQQGMDSLIADVARVSGPVEGGTRGDLLPTPRINVDETDDEVRLTAELPGVSEKDVQITLDDDVLVLSGEKRQEHETDKGNLRIVERAFGQFRRALQLPFTPNPEKVQARYRDGILTVTIPKEAEQRARMRQIEVKREEGAPTLQHQGSATATGSSKEQAGASRNSKRKEQATA